jgi:ATPase family AAA domain-containing protein 3A/B
LLIQEAEEYKAKLAADRMELENQKARQRNKELVEMQMQAEAKKEALRRATEEEIQAERRKTDEHRAALERENMKERALAEAEGRIREKRANEDLFLRQVGAFLAACDEFRFWMTLGSLAAVHWRCVVTRWLFELCLCVVVVAHS